MKNIYIFSLLLVQITGCAGYTYSGDSNIVISNDLSLLELQFRTKPNRVADKTNPDGSEMFIVQDGPKWCGLTVWTIIPVPIWFPGCHTHIEVTYKDGTPTRVEHQWPVLTGRLCGPFMPLIKVDDTGTSGFCPNINVKAY